MDATRGDNPAAASAANLTGPALWRSLQERANDPEFARWLGVEYPTFMPEALDGVTRRTFLKLAAASLALAGVTGCRTQPPEAIVPAVLSGRGFTPGRPEYFSTALRCGPEVLGVMVESNMGRPTKIEGNPDHPASLGATNLFAQAEILRLYDPQRAQAVTRGEEISTWGNFRRALQVPLDAVRVRNGAGLLLVTPPVTSPTLLAQLQRLLVMLPEARWHVHDPLDPAGARDGGVAALGDEAQPVYRFDQADRILALDCDFLFGLPGSVRYARDFARRRRPYDGEVTEPNRLYVAEPCPSVTGSNADERLPLRAGELFGLASAVGVELGIDLGPAPAVSERGRNWARTVAADLRAHAGRSIVLAGRSQPAAVHALCWAINERLGAPGETVALAPPPPVGLQPASRSLPELASALAEKPEAVLLFDVNPVYDASAEADLGALLVAAPFTVHAGLYRNETAQACTWRLPLTHPLETWGDEVAFDGTVSLVQPLIRPLYSSRSALELLAILTESVEEEPQNLVMNFWRSQYDADGFDDWWRAGLRSGVLREAPANGEVPPVNAGAVRELVARHAAAGPRDPAAGSGFEVCFRPANTLWDGSYAENGWLQELPDSLTKLCWGNAVLVSPATARRLRLRNEQLVTLISGERTLRAPIWIQPGHADDCVTLTLGYGRSAAGQIGEGVGYNAGRLRTSRAPWFITGVRLEPTAEQVVLTCTQHHQLMEGRELVKVATVGKLQEQHGVHISLPVHQSLYPPKDYDGQQWGMAIDLARCVACNACVVACQAENNIPVVGPEQVRMGREMHWIRVDRYFQGEPDNPDMYHQPVPCMHCENAPCELVCPTAATAHSHDGLNEMTYNRCIGTRYCSNNCPYKVRRFNFLDYTDRTTPTLKMMRNPEVTVRARGVMEKCTYCVQRIRTADIAARKENRPVRDGEIVTACQQVCPAQAITFGNINDASARVTAVRAQPHHYGLLEELNTRPRTTYLAALHNPSPKKA